MTLPREDRASQRAYDAIQVEAIRTECTTCDGGGCNQDDTGPCPACGTLGYHQESEQDREARVESEQACIRYAHDWSELHGRI